jgi:Fur family transcriptional regulator, peroxide stress response regulator
MENFIKQSKLHNLKITPQRMAIYQAIVNKKNHPSAKQVYQEIKKSLPNISFDTINRTLLSFCQIGLLRIIEKNNGPRQFDPNISKHSHFYCTNCSKIIDIDYKLKLNIKKIINNQDINVVKNQILLLEGICQQCQNKIYGKSRKFNA